MATVIVQILSAINCRFLGPNSRYILRAMGELKPKMAASIRKIRDVFVHGWDSIGVGNTSDWPQDEYDSYVLPVYSILRQGKDEAALLNYLVQVHHHINGTTVAPEKLRDVPAKFLQIDVSEDEIHH